MSAVDELLDIFKMMDIENMTRLARAGQRPRNALLPPGTKKNRPMPEFSGDDEEAAKQIKMLLADGWALFNWGMK